MTADVPSNRLVRYDRSEQAIALAGGERQRGGDGERDPVRADKAKAAVIAAYPGGTVNRVVRLSDDDYNVHVIGVNWPHHVLVDKDFKVIGAA